MHYPQLAGHTESRCILTASRSSRLGRVISDHRVVAESGWELHGQGLPGRGPPAGQVAEPRADRTDALRPASGAGRWAGAAPVCRRRPCLRHLPCPAHSGQPPTRYSQPLSATKFSQPPTTASDQPQPVGAACLAARTAVRTKFGLDTAVASAAPRRSPRNPEDPRARTALSPWPLRLELSDPRAKPSRAAGPAWPHPSRAELSSGPSSPIQSSHQCSPASPFAAQVALPELGHGGGPRQGYRVASRLCASG